MSIIPGLILHVDDESVRVSMSTLLRAKGYGIVSAANGAEALRLVSEGLYPDVLIVEGDPLPADRRERNDGDRDV